MPRILRAFVWMRWRVLVNSLERSGARDTVERFSLAIEQLGPIMAAVLMVPSAIALAGAGAYSGWALAHGEPSIVFETLRYLLFAACALTIVGPFLLPAAERTNAVRLLLLPIPRRTLYAAQTATALADPWLALVVPAVVTIPLGLLAGGAFVPAAVAAIGGLLLIAALTGTTSLVSSLIHLVVRNRRRGELLALVFILVVPFVGLIPAMVQDSHERRIARDGMATRRREAPAWLRSAEQVVRTIVPSEMYVRATRGVAAGNPRAAAPPLISLLAGGVAVHVLAMLVFGRMLDSPITSGGRRGATSRRAWTLRIPGLSPGVSAVAAAHVKLALRTPRGRSVLLSPFVVCLMFGLLMWRSGTGMDLAFIRLQDGVGLAAFAGFICLLSILPLAMNQFAVDGAGLTLELLAPLEDGELLAGKAVGNAVIAFGPALVCFVLAAAAFPGGDPAVWACLPLGLLAAYLIGAPVAAVLSAVFPRAVDMNSIGRGSNAHGAAGFIGFGAFAIAALPGILLAVLAVRWLERPWLAPLFLTGWCVVAALLAWALFIPARAIFARRRENLALIA